MDGLVAASSERQQLVEPGDEEEAPESRPGGPELSLSPPASSSGSRTHRVPRAQPHHAARVAYVSERRPARPRGPPPPCPPPPASATTSTTQQSQSTKEASQGAGVRQQDARQTQADLLRLLAAFRAPRTRPGHAEQLAHVRQQQDDLARLHFKLGSDPDAPAKPASARETMARLVQSLEQLSTSIEQLHLISEGPLDRPPE